MVNAQEWLNKEYPINRRSEITKLDISKGKIKKWLIHDSKLKGDLKLERFTNLRVLNCSGHELTNLGLSECSNLEELYCQNNQLYNLNITGCSNLKKLNCIFNNLKEVDISSSELTEDAINSDLIYKKDKLIKINRSFSQRPQQLPSITLITKAHFIYNINFKLACQKN